MEISTEWRNFLEGAGELTPDMKIWADEWLKHATRSSLVMLLQRTYDAGKGPDRNEVYERAKAYFSSEKGKREMEESLRKTKELIAKLDEERKITQEMLDIVFTI